MSRQIDLTKPLSDEDREYLLARNRKRDIALADAYASGDDPGSAHTTPDDSLTGSTERSPSAQPAAVGAQNADGQGGTEPPIASPAADANDQRKEDSEDSDDGDNYDDEEAWSYADLKDEVKGREKDDSPALNSSREDLVAWLRKDDAREDDAS